MRIARAGLLFATSALFSLPLFAEGEKALQFLNIGVGPRALGMGGAAVALQDGAASVYWNPAGALLPQRQDISFSHVQWLDQFRYETISYMRPVNRRWSVGIGADYFSNAKIQGFDDGGIPTGDFGVSDLAVIGTLAGDAGSWLGMGLDRFFIGTNVKFLREDLHVDAASTYAADLGILAVPYEKPDRLLLDRVRFGLSVSNIGPPLKFNNESNSLPAVLRAGVSTRWWAKSLIANADYEAPQGEAGSARFGVEYKAAPILALRAGYRWVMKDNQKTLQNGLHAGFGIQIGNVWIDYAYVPFRTLDNTHFFGFHASFGPQIELEKVEQRIQAHYLAAQQAYLEKDYARAQRELTHVLTVDPSHDGARRLSALNQKQLASLQVERQVAQGRRMIFSGDYGQAKEQFQSILAAFPEHPEAKKLLEQTHGLIEEQKGQRKEALTKQGEDFYKLGQYQSAVDLWEKVLILDPNDEPVKKSLNDARVKWEEQKKELAAAEERARLEKGWTALNAKDADRAKQVAEEVLNDNPASEGANLLLSQANGRLADDLLIKGRAYVKSNDFTKAYGALKTAANLDPDNKIVQDLLDLSRREVVKAGREDAMTLYSQQKYREALDKFNYLLEVDPNAEDLAGARQESIRKLGETIRVEAEILNKQGLKAYDEGNYREAVKFWKKVLELVPDHVNAKRNLERVRQQLDQ